MKKFFKRLFIISIPIVVSFIIFEYSLRIIPNDYSYKNQYLASNSKHIEYLILGNSHAYYGVNPEYINGKAFNAAHILQTIEYDYEIFNKYKYDFDSLKAILISIDPYTLFNPGPPFMDSKRVKNYELYYNISKSYHPKNQFEILNYTFSYNLKRCYFYFLNGKNSISCSRFGYFKNTKNISDRSELGVRKARLSKAEDEQYFSKNIQYINNFIQFANEKKIELIFFTPPGFHTYTDNLNKDQLEKTTSAIIQIVAKNERFRYYNFLKNQDFEAVDFSDPDHLNEHGAKKLSIQLNTLIGEKN